ncbi:MAG: hypothetical protein FWF06_08615, partial [Symbiobacteriaceae bacterium]|nr:hypothetical protein [Symbiobacteriaceae bacterium]
AALSAISQKMADDDYSPEGMYCKLFIPSVFLNYLKHASQLSETERMTRQQAVVNKVLRYCQAAPSGVDKQRLNEYLGYFGKECIDHSQAETYLDLLLRFTSLSHIYTYIHSLQVEMLVTVFLNYLITTSPELLVGLSDTNSVEEVVAKGENILALGRRAGLCHDIGKITYTNTVALCSRHLYDFEFNLIKKHVNVVDEFPENDEIIDSIRDVIIGHHKWYDGSKGYPLDFDNTASKYKIIIDIVSVADSIDAATDAIGRSYAPPNSFARVVQEIKDQAGTRYSPYLAAALNDVAFLQELELVITAKRRLSYYKAYSTILGDA